MTEHALADLLAKDSGLGVVRPVSSAPLRKEPSWLVRIFVTDPHGQGGRQAQPDPGRDTRTSTMLSPDAPAAAVRAQG